MKPTIKGILFDKDGTLLDYHLSWGPLNKRAALFAARGNETLTARLLACGGVDQRTGRAISGSLLASANTREIAEAWIDAGSTYDVDALTDAVDDIFRSGVATVVPVCDLASLFRRLTARGLKLGIASSDSAAAIHMTVERFGLAGDVAFIAGYDSGHGSKPGPGMLKAFAAQSQIDARHIAVVGDNLHDMEMARSGGAGLKVGVLTGTSSAEQLAPASDLCLASIVDLETALFG